MNFFINICVFIVLTSSFVEPYKVLVIYPLPVRSVNILGQGFVRHLLNAGHEVTFVTVFPLKNAPAKNFRQVDISDNMKILEGFQEFNMSFIMANDIEDTDILAIQEFATGVARFTFENENFQKLLKDQNEEFDVVISDLCESEVYAGLSVLYNVPMVWAYSMGAHWQVLRLIDQPTNPAFDPNYVSLNLFPLTLTQRIEELWTRIAWYYYKIYITGPKEENLYQNIFGPLLAGRGRPLPKYDDVMYNASFIFGNEHNAIKYKPSTPENFKNVGGLHIEVPTKPLPKDLQDLMDNSKHGVIYFSMGSLYKSKWFPEMLVTQLLEVFGELKQTVIWKYEEKLPNVPKNVHIVHWAPQSSILAHPNCMFFITHGGLLSSIESVHFGVSTIGMPIYFDQFININKAVAAGYAIKVNLDYDMPKNLRTAIRVMLKDDSFRKKAKELSEIYHDRPMTPGAELVHWVEHVVRTRGALHLRSPALHVPLYQKFYLDLIAMIVTALFVLLVLLKRLCSKVLTKRVDDHKLRKKNK